ncbi:NeuD/PglB/VioB family sugar acetyltransferase [Longibaculum muris]|uniref:NeuD/PglB/VioB family sugar acetyltransferase n=1 Tax=Longibaculum muris TaxID=1796628 RepID=UPI0022E73953|nr:NeuD/PglB/VioB family sugar acetyltransferase [Longibaculum muris]
MKKLLIVGAGGHGRCCLDIARDMNIYDEICFLDDLHMNEVINDCEVIGTIDEMSSYYPEYVDIFIAIGNNQLRKKLNMQAKEIGYQLASLISPFSYVSSYANINEGTVVFPHAVIEANVYVGKGCIISSNTTLNHDSIIKDNCLIYSNSVIRPNVIIESLTKIGSHCVISFGIRIESNSVINDGSVIDLSEEFEIEVKP